MVPKTVKLRAKITTIGDRKMHMIIPVRFHNTNKKFNMLGQYVDVEIMDTHLIWLPSRLSSRNLQKYTLMHLMPTRFRKPF
jgi:hypothetical protein